MVGRLTAEGLTTAVGVMFAIAVVVTEFMFEAVNTLSIVIRENPPKSIAGVPKVPLTAGKDVFAIPVIVGTFVERAALTDVTLADTPVKDVMFCDAKVESANGAKPNIIYPLIRLSQVSMQCNTCNC